MSYKRKTRDVWHVLINYGFGHGWEIATAATTREEARSLLRDYRDNQSYPVRIRKTRVPIEAR